MENLCSFFSGTANPYVVMAVMLWLASLWMTAMLLDGWIRDWLYENCKSRKVASFLCKLCVILSPIVFAISIPVILCIMVGKVFDWFNNL